LSKTTADAVTGALIAPDPLKEAEELLRLIDAGRFDDVSAWLMAAQSEARLRALDDVLGSTEETDKLKAAV
jgi:hypothetical protein